MKINAKKEFIRNKSRIGVAEAAESASLSSIRPAEKAFLRIEDRETVFKSLRETYLDQNGIFQPISTQINDTTEGFTSYANNFGVVISRKLEENKGMLLDDGKHTIEIVPNIASPVQGQIASDDDSTVIFENFNGADDLYLTLRNSGVKMEINIPEFKDSYSYTFRILTTNLISSWDSVQKTIVFVDKETKEKVFTIKKPVLYNQVGEVMTTLGSNYTEEGDDSYLWTISLPKHWIELSTSYLPIKAIFKIEEADRPVVSLSNFKNGVKYDNGLDELLLGVHNYWLYSVRATILTGQIIAEIKRTKMKEFQVGLKLHYENKTRLDGSQGFAVYHGTELVTTDAFNSDEQSILIDLSEIIKKEWDKYLAGMEISDIVLDLVYFDKSNVMTSDMSSGSIDENTIEEDYLVISDRETKEALWRPQISLQGQREKEVRSDTPFIEVDTLKGGISRVNVVTQELGHHIYLGTIRDKGLSTEIKLVYDTRTLKEQLDNSLDSYLGKGWRINIATRLVKSANYSKLLGSKDTIYYDSENNPHLLEERWYYEDKGVRHYIQKELVYIGNDQKLKYRNLAGEVFDVEYEAKSEEGLTLVSTDSKANYVKKSDLKIKKRYFMCLGNNTRYEVFKDEDGLISIPHFYKTREEIEGTELPEWLGAKEFEPTAATYQMTVYEDITNVSNQDQEFVNSDGEVLKKESFRRQLYYKNGKYYVKGLKKSYQIRVAVTSMTTTFEDYDADGVEIELEVENEYYVDQTIPLADYYENEDIVNINNQILQCHSQIKSLRQQSESVSSAVMRTEDELNRQIMILGPNFADTSLDNRTQNSDITYLRAQLKEQQMTLQTIYENLTSYEGMLLNLEEKKNALVKIQKEDVQDLIMDEEGTIFGFDYYGKLIYITDQYENEIVITYDHDRVIEVASKEGRMVFHYDDEQNLDYVVDAEGRRKTFVIENKLLKEMTFLGENQEKQAVHFNYEENIMTMVEDPSGTQIRYTWKEKLLVRIQKMVIADTISTDEETKLEDYKTVLDYKLDKNSVNTYVGDVLTLRFVMYYFDNIGRTCLYEYKDGKTRVVNLRHYDDRKELFNVTYPVSNNKNIKTVTLGQGVIKSKTFTFVIDKDTEGHVSRQSILKDDLVFISFAPNDAMWKDNEFELTVNVHEKSGTTRTYKQKFIRKISNMIGIPFAIYQDDQSFDFTFTALKDIDLGNGKSFFIKNAHGSIYEYDEKENLVHEIRGSEELFFEDFINKQPSTIRSVDKFKVERVTHYLYDSHDRLVFKEDHLGNCQEVIYDEKGRVVEKRTYNKECPVIARISRLTYDENGRVSQMDNVMRDEKGEYPQESYRYYPNSSKLRTLISPNGQVTCYGYDFNSDDLLAISSDAQGFANRTTMKYRYGLLTSLSHHGFTIDYVLDGQGRKKSVKIGDDELVSFTYDDDFTFDTTEHCKKVTKTINGNEFTSVTDNDGFILQTTGPDGETIDYAHNDEGNTTSVDNGTSEIVTTTYLNKGRVASNIHQYDGALDTETGKITGGITITEDYDYSSKDLLNKITYYDSDGYVGQITYVYDEKFDNRVQGASLLSRTKVNVEYDPLGRVISKKVLDNETPVISEEYEYLQYGEHAIDLIKEHIIKVNGDTTKKVSYQYDVSGNIIEEKGDDYYIRYRYDKLNRLIREDNSRLNTSFTYEYDNGGNILLKNEYPYSLEEVLVAPTSNKKFSYREDGWRDQLVKYGDITISYDAMGRPKEFNNLTLTWNKKGQMTGYGNHTFGYNMQGIRIFKDNIQYYLVGNRIIKEKSLTGDHEIIFEYGIDKLEGFCYNGVKYFYERNIQGDIIRIIESGSNSVVAEYKYDAWGNHEVINKTVDEIGNVNPFRYRGYYYDKETGLYYLNSRYYSPEMCRFISPDELSILDETKAQINGLNLYMYCNDNPVMYSDPSGCFAIATFLISLCVNAIIGAVASATAYAASELVSYALTGEFTWSWADFVGSIIGGAIGGAISAIPWAGTMFVAGISGFASTASGMLLQNAWEGKSYTLGQILLVSTFNGLISASAGGLFESIPIKGLNSGRGSYSAVTKQMITKLFNGTIKRISYNTFSKMLTYNLIGNSIGAFASGIMDATDANDWLARLIHQFIGV